MPRDLDATVTSDSARAFASDLARFGIQCGVDARDAVALVVPDDEPSAERFVDEGVRRAVLERARAHGFVRVALVIGDR